MVTIPFRRMEPSADPVWQARVDLAAVHRLAHRYGFDDGIWNHLTLMVPGTKDQFLVKPHGALMSEVTASNLIVSNFEGKIVDGKGYIESSAFCIHSQFHKLHPHGACVLHLHPPYSTWITMTKPGRLLMIHQDALRFYDRIAYDDVFQGLGTSLEEGARMAKATGDKPLALSANHGLTSVGDTVAEAWYDLYYLEQAAKQQHLVMSSGQEPRVVPEQIAQFTKSQLMDEWEISAKHAFDAMKRDLDREEPDYKT
ncbi:MAG: class II aldolase/adducin family protein [Alphaproteobacteria bacterium]